MDFLQEDGIHLSVRSIFKKAGKVRRGSRHPEVVLNLRVRRRIRQPCSTSTMAVSS
jgi:hypothetical protein